MLNWLSIVLCSADVHVEILFRKYIVQKLYFVIISFFLGATILVHIRRKLCYLAASKLSEVYVYFVR